MRLWIIIYPKPRGSTPPFALFCSEMFLGSEAVKLSIKNVIA